MTQGEGAEQFQSPWQYHDAIRVVQFPALDLLFSTSASRCGAPSRLFNRPAPVRYVDDVIGIEIVLNRAGPPHTGDAGSRIDEDVIQVEQDSAHLQ